MNIRRNTVIAATVVAGTFALLSSAPATAVPKILQTLDELALQRTSHNPIVPQSRLIAEERQREGVEVASTDSSSVQPSDEVIDVGREDLRSPIRNLHDEI